MNKFNESSQGFFSTMIFIESFHASAAARPILAQRRSGHPGYGPPAFAQARG
jgi:hypothetical protein